MERTCTLCKFTTSSDFSWESHLSRDDHRILKLKADPFSPLSVREKHILLMIQNGKTNGEIAVTLGFAHGTVRNYLSEILRSLKCGNRASLAAYAMRHGLEASRFWETDPLPDDEAVMRLYRAIAKYSHFTAARVIEELS